MTGSESYVQIDGIHAARLGSTNEALRAGKDLPKPDEQAGSKRRVDCLRLIQSRSVCSGADHA